MAQDEDDCFTKPTACCLNGSLGVKMIRQVDKARDLITRLGLRQYVVKVIHTAWTGPARGQGAELVVREMTILPVPAISSLSGVRKTVTPVGLDEVGTLQLTEVSGRYTELEVLGTMIKGVPLDPTVEQAFYEVTFLRGNLPEKRRFSVNNVPSYSPEDFQWTVTLERAREDRDAYTGDPQ